MNNDVILRVNGVNYTGWEEISTVESIEAIAAGFNFITANNLDGNGNPFPILTGDACQIIYNNETVITGYVDDSDPTFDEKSEVTITGRSKTGDLTDCSAELPSGVVKKQTLDQIIRKLIEKYDIGLIVDVPTGERFAEFRTQQGESVFEAIDRACRQRGVLPSTNADGNLVLTKIGAYTSETALIEGVNIKKAMFKSSMKSRFSSYTVKGQAPGTDNAFGAKNISPAATVTDPRINRYRPLIVIAEGQTNKTAAQKRAEWELAVRAAKSRQLTVITSGWAQNSGKLWRPNTLVPVVCPAVGIGEPTQLLISAVSRKFTETEGKTTELTLCSSDSYIPEPQTDLNKKKKQNPFLLNPKA